MSNHVFVVSEWLAKKGKDDELWEVLNNLMVLSRQESGCVRAHATRQVLHPGSPSKSKYNIVLLQEYIDIAAFDVHCASDYVSSAFKKHIENKNTAIVEEWQCRLFSENE